MAVATALFNPTWYLATQPDVRAAVESGLITAFDHFVLFGINEGRSPTPLLDVDFYLQQNPDVAAAVQLGLISAPAHFIHYGSSEPRQINPFIHLGTYLQANPDVAEAVAYNGLNALMHLLNYGVTEGRDLGNGIRLSVFAHDPAFQQALSLGNVMAALERVAQVAPFLPDFVPPEGWTPPPDTPIPLDFVPAEGVRLVIPETIVVPANTPLPDFIRPVQPPEPKPLPPTPPATPPQPAPAVPDNDYGPTFTVTHLHGEHLFGGTATGLITLDIDPDGLLSFSRGGITVKTMLDSAAWATGSNAIRLQADQTLTTHAGLLDGVRVMGDGSVYVADDSHGPVTLDIGTNGAGNVINTTDSNDTLTIRGSGLNAIVPGKGADTIWLETEPDGVSIITISAGAAARYTTNVQLQTSYAIEGHQAFIYLGLVEEGLITEYTNGTWGDLRHLNVYPTPADLTTLPLTYGVSVDGNGLVSIVRDQPFAIYAAEQMDAGKHNPFPIVNPITAYGTSPLSADSHFWAMDEIHGFTPGQDMLHPAKLYVGGNGESNDVLADAVFTVDGITFNIADGLATVSAGTLPGTDTLQYVLEQLSVHMNTNRRMVAYEHEDATYLLDGDGVAGLAVSDMVVKLTGVKDLDSIDALLFGLMV